ncbi:hypothetical protein [Mesorhizobium sp. WSM2239]|uniref:Uncharacterized protein n=2 Tax=unclassified Mesorhizobium TaxID=325217 RepID=A0AAU8DJ97_9HYPH
MRFFGTIINTVNRLGETDSHDALDIEASDFDHAAMESGERRLDFKLSMLRLLREPSQSDGVRLFVVPVEVGMLGDVPGLSSEFQGEPLDIWLARRRLILAQNSGIDGEARPKYTATEIR